MSRIHGRRGRVYIGILNDTALAEPLPFVAKWSANFPQDQSDVTAMGDSNHVYVAGLPDPAGDFSGFYDNATAQTYTAATDGLARKFYLYPDLSTATQYWFGTVLVDMQVDGGVDGPVTMKASWKAASTIAKVG